MRRLLNVFFISVSFSFLFFLKCFLSVFGMCAIFYAYDQAKRGRQKKKNVSHVTVRFWPLFDARSQLTRRRGMGTGTGTGCGGSFRFI